MYLNKNTGQKPVDFKKKVGKVCKMIKFDSYSVIKSKMRGIEDLNVKLTCSSVILFSMCSASRPSNGLYFGSGQNLGQTQPLRGWVWTY